MESSACGRSNAVSLTSIDDQKHFFLVESAERDYSNLGERSDFLLDRGVGCVEVLHQSEERQLTVEDLRQIHEQVFTAFRHSTSQAVIRNAVTNYGPIHLLLFEE